LNIKKMFIIPALIVTLVIFWQFVTNAALYDPFARFDIKEQEAGAREDLKNEFTSAWGNEIIERNLFSPDRKRPSLKARNSAAVDIKPPEMALKGVMLTRDGEYEAYIQIEKKQPLLVKKGETFNDIKIVEIQEKTVRLKWKHKFIELTL
jgi:hypothetical protein